MTLNAGIAFHLWDFSTLFKHPLKGRRFYGVFDEDAGRYWACVQRRGQDDPDSLGLKTCSIGGGLYASKRLRGDFDELIALIAPAFEEMGARYNVDPSCPAIEFYRRHNEFVLYLPVTEPQAGFPTG